MQFCPKCGADWRPNANFCTNCGYRLSISGDEPGAGFLDPAASSAQKPEPKRKRPLSSGSRAVRAVVSALLCLPLFCALMSGMALASVRIAASRTAIDVAVRGLDLGQVYLDDQSVTLADKLYEELDDETAAHYGITKEKLTGFLDKSTVPAFLSGVMGDFASDFFDGNGKGVVTADDVTELIFDNADVIEEELGYPIDEQDRGRIRNNVVDAMDGEELNLVEAFSQPDDALALRYVRGIFSYTAIGILFGVALACALGIFFLWLGHFVPFSRFVGIPLTVAGALYLLSAAGVLALPWLIHGLAGVSSELLTAILCPGGVGIGIMALLTLLVGVFLLAAGTRKKASLSANG